MLWTDKANKILNKYWKYTNLKVKQIEVINELLTGNDVIGILPTGYGKSLCYMLPSLVTKKVTIIISPLISLMDEQKKKLIDIGIPVATLHSNNENKNKECKEIIENKIKIVYMSPEYLCDGDGFKLVDILIENNTLGFFAVDESHCLSSWGRDFRPTYLKIKKFREFYPNIPILAVTATATEKVISEISSFLKLENPRIVRANLDRPNLFLKFFNVPKEKNKYVDEWKIIKIYINKYPNDKIIIYITSIKDTVRLANDINTNINNCCAAYHASLDKNQRKIIQNKFYNGEIKVIVSTIAFGMGIDQVVKNVLVFGCPSSVEEYWQQIGRGGRDGLDCETVIYYKKKYSVNKKYVIKNDSISSEQKKKKINDLEQVENYFEIKTCRRRFILEYFEMDENYFVSNSFTCNKCDNCQNILTDITNEVYEHLINNKEIKYKNELYKLGKLENIYIEWKKYIISNNYNLDNIPSNMLIKLNISESKISESNISESNISESKTSTELINIYDKYENIKFT